jgi:phthalate 4,5-dioxygenase reductase subunit
MTAEPKLFRVLVERAEEAARGIQLFELRDPRGADLPAFTAGAHIAVRTPAGPMRHYSLANDPAERDRYVIAVKREAQGRGGSRSLVDGVRAGSELEIGAPDNQFALDPRARSFVLIAGGIGITPMRSMLLTLAREAAEGQPRAFRLVYLTRDPESTAFRSELQQAPFASHVVIHHDNGNPGKAFDLWPLLEKPGSVGGQHVYCCGPKPLMNAVRDMTGHWPAAAVHFESFGADTAPHADDTPFDVVLGRSGRTLRVPVGRTILDVVRAHGVAVPSSCESGTCGSCKTRLLDGIADHRDLVLLDEERADYVMVCVSRAKSESLVLDL